METERLRELLDDWEAAAATLDDDAGIEDGRARAEPTRLALAYRMRTQARIYETCARELREAMAESAQGVAA